MYIVDSGHAIVYHCLYENSLRHTQPDTLNAFATESGAAYTR
jgi:hypothetical protein